jgi:hypothetical protein
VLDPKVVLRADGGAVRAGASHEDRGARTVAGQALLWSRVDLTMQRALTNGGTVALSDHLSGCLHLAAAQRRQIIGTVEWFESFLAAFG